MPHSEHRLHAEMKKCQLLWQQTKLEIKYKISQQFITVRLLLFLFIFGIHNLHANNVNFMFWNVRLRHGNVFVYRVQKTIKKQH